MLPAHPALVVLLSLTVLICFVHGHGILWEPPSRASMWRRGYETPINYQDMELFCGGFSVQYEQNGGKCGVCGDPWNGERKHEAGGKYATGIITRYYQVGQEIDVVVNLTASHKGYFEFHICPLKSPQDRATHECLAKYPLKQAATGQVKYHVPDNTGSMRMRFRLPPGLKCRACLFQWKYNAGNSWGANPDGSGCIGCGNQEQFYGCSDVAIGYDRNSPNEDVSQETSSDEVTTGKGANVASTHLVRDFYNMCSLIVINYFISSLRPLLVL